MAERLRALVINECQYYELESVFAGSLKHVRYLSLGYSFVERLPECFCALYNLRNLKLIKCFFSKLPTNIGNLVSLEKLLIEGCIFLQQLPESLCQLTALRELVVSGCRKLEELPSGIGSLTNLQTLELEKCAFKELPTSIRNLVNLENLVIKRCCFLERLPDSLCRLEALRKLLVCQCSNLGELPSNIGNLVSIENLVMESSEFLKRLPESLCQLKALRKLVVSECNKFEELPSSIGSLTNLQTLELRKCAFKELPTSIRNLVNLENLVIRRCYFLKRLPDSLCQLKALRKLVVCQCGYLGELPSNIVNLTNLQTLKVSRCNSSIPLSLAKIMEIQSLMLDLVCDTIGQLKHYVNLGGTLCLENLQNLSNLTDLLCGSLASMHKLQFLLLNWGNSLYGDWYDFENEIGGNVLCLFTNRGQSIPPEDQNHFAVMARLQPHSNLKSLGKLKYLLLARCDSLRIIRAESLPPELQDLTIDYCNNLISVPGIQRLNSLVKLCIKSCDNLHLLMMDPEHSVELTRLTNESSYLLGLRNLTSLKSLQIRWCRKLQLLADELLCVKSCEVEIESCPLLKEWCLQNGIDYYG